MAIERIEEYKQQDGAYILKVFTKPTKTFPKGSYFYAPAEAIELVKKYTWGILCLKTPYISANDKQGVKHSFHQELFNFYHNCYTYSIDHLNHCRFDNVDQNLNAVTSSQNNHNNMAKNYSTVIKNKEVLFIPQMHIKCDLYIFDSYRSENEACTAIYDKEHGWLKDLLGDEWYLFDFMKYRKNDTDLLDLERTGVLSEEEATYQYILRYADNAWYYLRYGLQEYFKDNHIPVPKYSLDENGFMIHPITGEKLCPEFLRSLLHNKDIICFRELQEKRIKIARPETEIMEIKQRCLGMANDVRKMYADGKRKRVLSLLLQGYTPKQIIEITGFTSSVVYKAISTIDEDFMKMFLESNIDSSITEDMINLYINCGFDYKKYRQYKYN